MTVRSIIMIFVLGAVASVNGQRPVPLIFDTDIGNDVDDVLALGEVVVGEKLDRLPFVVTENVSTSTARSRHCGCHNKSHYDNYKNHDAEGVQKWLGLTFSFGDVPILLLVSAGRSSRFSRGHIVSLIPALFRR